MRREPGPSSGLESARSADRPSMSPRRAPPAATRAHVRGAWASFVAFEGGGEALQALQGGHVQAVSGDAAEASRQIVAGAPLRMLAVLADQRLPGLPDVATASEQGIALSWPAVRGFYVGPKVSGADYRAWVDAFSTAMAAPGFAARRAEYGLYPFELTGAELDAYVRRTVADYRQLAQRLKLPLRE